MTTKARAPRARKSRKKAQEPEQETVQETVQEEKVAKLGTVEITAKQRKEWANFYKKQPKWMTDRMEKYNVDPFSKYALKDAPHRAIYYVVVQVGACMHEHVHVDLEAYSHDGQKFGILLGVTDEELVPYPYTEDELPGEDVLLEERQALERVTAFTKLHGNGLVPFTVGYGSEDDPTKDPLSGESKDKERWH